MRRYLLPEAGTFYKANLHCHTCFSDGALTPAQVRERYRKLGYSIVAYTDHNVMVAHDELTDEGFLALHGFEVDFTQNKKPWSMAKTCHLCLVAIDKDNLRHPCWNPDHVWGDAKNYVPRAQSDPESEGFIREYTPECINRFIARARETRFFVTYNHPAWSKEHYPDYIGLEGLNALEIMNGVCQIGGYEDYNTAVYDDFLSVGKMLYCVAGDDNHNHSPEGSARDECGVAFTMIKAPELTYGAVTAAMLRGDMYASEGPEIYELYAEDGKAYIRTSPAARIMADYQARVNRSEIAPTGQTVTEAVFDIAPENGWVRFIVVDSSGRHACTRAYLP